MAETIRLTVQEQNQQVPMSVEQARIIEAISPEAEVKRVEGGAELTVTDYRGTTSVVINDGEPGEPGDPGQPGVSPTVTVTDITGGHRVTVTDATGPHSFDVMNGEPGEPGDPAKLIDDTSTTAQNRTWSAYKLNNEIDAKYTKPVTGIPASDLESGVIPSVPVQDVQINGSSILNNGVANVPIMGGDTFGVAKTSSSIGVSNGFLYVLKAISSYIKAGTEDAKPIVPEYQHQAAFYGLAKAAGADMASLSSVTVGQYPEAQKKAICAMLGVKYEAPFRLIKEITITEETSVVEIAKDQYLEDFSLTDVVINFSGMTATNTSNTMVLINNANVQNNGPYLIVPNGYMATARYCCAQMSVKGGKFFGSAMSNSASSGYSNTTMSSNPNAFGLIDCGNITNIKIASINSHKYTGGTITVYGR